MTTAILGVGLCLAVIDWIAVGLRVRWLEYIAKPGVMLLILAWLISNGGLFKPLVWFTAGAAFALVGDVFLMLPSHKFIAGLASFSLAYLCYCAGFIAYSQPFNLAFFVVLCIIFLPAVKVLRKLSNALVKNQQQKLIPPFLFYTGILSLMLALACARLIHQDWQTCPAIMVSSGTFLLFSSDILLVWNRFIEPIHHGRLKVITTYHIGQLLVAYSVVLQSLSKLSL
ncbi:MAG TPA: lysoplasmalogenase [Anaerolineales bacterium]|nr:lysoplasmalogenase [Anaerolineales bacterium]